MNEQERNDLQVIISQALLDVGDLKSCSSADRSACPHIDHQVVSSSRTVIRKR